MSRYFSIILSIIILISTSISVSFWLRAFYGSVVGYESPLAALELKPQTAALPKAARVIIVVVNGLGAESVELYDWRALRQLNRSGASTTVQAFPPTYSQTARMTLVSGAPPELNGALPLDRPAEELSLNQVDTVFARAHEAQLKTALVGLADWRRLIPRNYLDEVFYVDSSGPDADQAILSAALFLLQENDYDLILIQFTELAYTAKHQGGVASAAYVSSVAQLNDYLDQISRAADLSDTVLFILGDHGVTAAGGIGGSEPEVIQQPLVIVGPGIIPGAYSNVLQTDIAPTVTALLGVAPPASAQGRILFEMLHFDEQAQTQTQLILARQRVALADAYLKTISDGAASVPESLFADLDQTQTAFDQNNLSGAFQLALLTQEVADSSMAAARSARISAEQWPRLLLMLAIMSGWLFTMWRRRGSHLGTVVVATLVTVGLYHALYQLQGYSYSISSLQDFFALPLEIVRRLSLSFAAGGTLMLIVLILVSEKDWLVSLGTGYGFSVLVTFAFALPLAWAYWQNGATVSWHLPAVEPVYWQVMGLIEVLAVATLGLFLPWPITLLNMLVNVLRRKFGQGQARSGPDALPGLHL